MPATVRAATDANFAQVVLRSQKPVLVSFWAEWCSACRQIDPALKQVAADHPEVRVVRLNIDDSPASAASAGVTSIPTLKIYQSGTVVKTMTSARSKAAIEQGLTSLFNHKP
ncbi:thioredoxin family protein [Peterkaempfera sp. SMS 1(5)a]